MLILSYFLKYETDTVDIKNPTLSAGFLCIGVRMDCHPPSAAPITERGQTYMQAPPARFESHTHYKNKEGPPFW
jgi:hypothetical protein